MSGTPVTLNLAAPSRGARGKPPRHFVDLTPEQRVEAVAALGEKPFRAKQLATHYFTHLTADPAEMTDLPQASRDVLVADETAPAIPHIPVTLSGGCPLQSQDMAFFRPCACS